MDQLIDQQVIALIFGGVGSGEMIFIAVIAILLFGKNLPSMAKKFGKSYREFRDGLNDIKKDVRVDDYMYDDSSSNSYSSSASGTGDWSASDYDDYDESLAPKFDPPPSEPVSESESLSSDDDVIREEAD